MRGAVDSTGRPGPAVRPDRPPNARPRVARWATRVKRTPKRRGEMATSQDRQTGAWVMSCLLAAPAPRLAASTDDPMPPMASERRSEARARSPFCTSVPLGRRAGRGPVLDRRGVTAYRPAGQRPVAPRALHGTRNAQRPLGPAIGAARGRDSRHLVLHHAVGQELADAHSEGRAGSWRTQQGSAPRGCGRIYREGR